MAKQQYKDFEIEVKRERCLGGWKMNYITMVREVDGLVLSHMEDSNESKETLFHIGQVKIDNYLTGDALNDPHHIECCTFHEGPDSANLCPACLDVLDGGPPAERELAETLKTEACSICGKTGYFKYAGPTYGA